MGSLVASIMVGTWPTICVIAVPPGTGLLGPEDVGGAFAVPTCMGLSGHEDVGAAIVLEICPRGNNKRIIIIFLCS